MVVPHRDRPKYQPGALLAYRGLLLEVVSYEISPQRSLGKLRCLNCSGPVGHETIVHLSVGDVERSAKLIRPAPSCPESLEAAA